MRSQVESFCSLRAELEPLFEVHYAELALDQTRVPLNPNWQLYEAIEASGCLLCVTLRDEDRLVGYYVGAVMPCLHYTIPTCSTDMFFVHPDVRGRFGGVRLFRAVKLELERRGVKRWFVGEKLHNPAGRLFKALGFRPIEAHYSMMLGD